MNNILVILSFVILATFSSGKDIPLLRRGDVQNSSTQTCQIPSEPIYIEVDYILEPIYDFFIVHGEPRAAKLLIEFKLPILCSIVSKNEGTTTPSSGT